MPKKQDPMTQAALAITEEEGRRQFEKLSAKEKRETATAFLSEAAGKVKAARFFEAQSSLMVLMQLRQVKESKLYKELGYTWADYCESIGLKRKTIDEKLSELGPVADEFLAAAANFGEFNFNKIRQLARAVSADFAKIEGATIVYGEERVEVSAENVEAVQEIIDRIGMDLGNRVEEAEAEARSQKRLAGDKEAVIRKQEKHIARLERTAEKEGLTPDELGFREEMERLKITFEGLSAKVNPEKLAAEFGDAMTPTMQAELLSGLVFMLKSVTALYDTATDIYGMPEE